MAAPGWTKTVSRLEVSEAIVSHALSEIAPIVERLTGWPGIGSRTRVRAVPTAADAFGPVLRSSGACELGWLDKRVLNIVLGIGGMAGLYDPFERWAPRRSALTNARSAS